jgi:hypothetical protein
MDNMPDDSPDVPRNSMSVTHCACIVVNICVIIVFWISFAFCVSDDEVEHSESFLKWLSIILAGSFVVSLHHPDLRDLLI